MISQKHITESKLLFFTPKIVSAVIFLFLVYIDIVLIFGHDFWLSNIKVFGYLGLFESIVLALTFVFGMFVSFLPGSKVSLLNNTTGNFSILEKVLFLNKYKIKKVLPLENITNVDVEEIFRTGRYGKVTFYKLAIKDSFGNEVFCKEYIERKKSQAEFDAEQIRFVMNGNVDSFVIRDYNYRLFEYIFVGLVIIQLLVNFNYIKQILFGAIT